MIFMTKKGEELGHTIMFCRFLFVFPKNFEVANVCK